MRYLDRRGYPGLPELPPPDPGLDLVVVVPALAEPDVIATLESVATTSHPDLVAEILLVVNAADNARPNIRRANAQSLANARAWAAGQHERRFSCRILDCRDLPLAHAGVGLARKIGMDAALARLAASNGSRGVIVSLDADCRVAANYLAAIDEYFCATPDALGATIYFEHPLDETPSESCAAIIDYELHLRCYRHGLRAAGSPYSCYTVGSAFAVRSEIYAQEGGMNRRSAGEDFYFLNKLLKRGKVGEINSTTVFPSARMSDRVPFGTGPALRRARDQPVTTYAPAVYRELQMFRGALEALVRSDQPVPTAYAPFLDSMAFDTWLTKARANAASEESLATQLTRWLDSFRTMKFIHWLTESRHPRVKVADAAREILIWTGLTPATESQAMLAQLRGVDLSVGAHFRRQVPPARHL